MKTARSIWGCLFVASILLLPHFSQAAALYIDPAFSSLNRGDAVSLAVRLDVDEEIGECINAVDAVITYPASVEPVDTSIGDSIFSMWVERPTINKSDRTITFAGGVPNGYCGRVAGDPRLTNTIAELIFRSPGFVLGSVPADNEAVIAFSPETTAYLNNGQGTKIKPDTYPATLTLEQAVGSSIQDPWNDEVDADNVPPEEFSIYLEKGETNPRGKWFITFNTTDKQTGIDEYQVMEEPISQFGSFEWGRADAPWVTVRSPYVLEDQTLNSIIRVRAIDKAGNEYVATLVPEESQRTMSDNQLYNMLFVGGALLIALLLLAFSVMFVLGKVRSRKRREENSTEGEDEGEEDDMDAEYEDDEYEDEAVEYEDDEYEK